MICGLDSIAYPITYPVIALGNFDGVHRGHQVLIRQVVDRARAHRGTSIVITFQPHPLKVLAPDLKLKFLASFEEKLDLLRVIGVDHVLWVPFTKTLSLLSPEEFVVKLLYDKLHVKEVFVGAGFSFGKDRTGTVKDLERLGDRYGYTVQSIQTVMIGGKPVSSSRIRELLMTGDVSEAGRLLGRIYSIEGNVVPGSRKASLLGFPTANLDPPEDRVVPADGVYAAWGVLEENPHKGIAYIGTQPTLGRQARAVELHFFDPQTNLYQKRLRVGFQRLVREEKTFADQTELTGQIHIDVTRAKELLHGEPQGNLLGISDENDRPEIQAKG